MDQNPTRTIKQTLGEFLDERRVKKEDPVWTFTGMADHMGKFNVLAEDYSAFLKIYHRHVFTQSKPAFLLERHAPDGGPILIDLDFRFPLTTPVVRQYTRDQIQAFVSAYAAAVHRFIARSKPLRFFLQEIPEPLTATDKKSGTTLTKDGVHILCPDIHMSFADQYALRNFMLTQKVVEHTFPDLVNSAADCLDESVIQRNNWFLYGSSKSVERVPYAVTACFTLAADGRFEEMDACLTSPRELIPTFSIRQARKMNYSIRPEVAEEFAARATSVSNPTKKAIAKTAPKSKVTASMSVTDPTDGSIAETVGPLILSARIAALLDMPGTWTVGRVEEDGFKIACASSFVCLVKPDHTHSEANHSVIFVNKKCATAACYSHSNGKVPKKTARALWLLLSGEEEEVAMDATESGVLIDDTYAAAAFVEACGPNIQREGDTLYYFDETTGMWSSHEDAFRYRVHKHKEALLFHSPEGKIMNYGGMERNIAAMRKSIRFQVPDTNFMRDNADKSLGKLLFADGIFDFATGFTPGFDPALVFLKRIDRPFPVEAPCDDLITQVDRVLFKDAFEEDPEGAAVGDYLKKAITMGLYGDYFRKKFYVAIGDANCGKGLIVCALRSAFCGYVDEFSANELIYNAGNSQDEARRLAWLKDLVGARVAFSNEMRLVGSATADGNLIKAISSGGDQHKVRGNFENGASMVNRVTCFCLANDFTKITPSPSSDTGLQERLRFSRYTKQFVEEPRGPHERLKNPDIKHLFKTVAWKDALFYVIWRCWTAMEESERKLDGDLRTPAGVRAETKEWVSDGDDSLRDVLEGRFEFTDSFRDMVSTKEVVALVLEKGLKMSKTKIGIEVRKMIRTRGWDETQKTKVLEIRSGNVSVYHGIRVKEMFAAS